LVFNRAEASIGGAVTKEGSGKMAKKKGKKKKKGAKKKEIVVPGVGE